jgi:hypothetical protein
MKKLALMVMAPLVAISVASSNACTASAEGGHSKAASAPQQKVVAPSKGGSGVNLQDRSKQRTVSGPNKSGSNVGLRNLATKPAATSPLSNHKPIGVNEMNIHNKDADQKAQDDTQRKQDIANKQRDKNEKEGQKQQGQQQAKPSSSSGGSTSGAAAGAAAGAAVGGPLGAAVGAVVGGGGSQGTDNNAPAQKAPTAADKEQASEAEEKSREKKDPSQILYDGKAVIPRAAPPPSQDAQRARNCLSC